MITLIFLLDIFLIIIGRNAAIGSFAEIIFISFCSQKVSFVIKNKILNI